jgi:hypothetical protein
MIEQRLAETGIKRQIASSAWALFRGTGYRAGYGFPKVWRADPTIRRHFACRPFRWTHRRSRSRSIHTHPRFASEMGIGWLRDMLAAMFAKTG